MDWLFESGGFDFDPHSAAERYSKRRERSRKEVTRRRKKTKRVEGIILSAGNGRQTVDAVFLFDIIKTFLCRSFGERVAVCAGPTD